MGYSLKVRILPRVFKASYSKNTMRWGLLISIAVSTPLVIILGLGREGPILFMVFMVSIFAVISALLLYTTLSGRTMNYELYDNEFRVNFSPMKFRIPYTFIKDVGRSKITLLFRLFGGSWPGLHWGLFKTDIGRVYSYSTKRNGDFVLLNLLDGRKIAISPQEPDKFIDELNRNRNLFGTASAREIQLFETSRKTIYLQILTVAGAYLLFLGYLLSVYPSLPDIIPVHFDLHWNPNRWAHKSELFIMAGLGAIFPVINTILALKFGKYGKELMIFLGVIFILVIALFLVIINSIYLMI
jgi:hypothetical protein